MSNLSRLERTAMLCENYDPSTGIEFNLEGYGYMEGDRLARACAVGLACFHQEFQDEGLGIFVGRTSNGFTPTYQGRYNWPAVTAFYEISGEQAMQLFHRARYPYMQHWGAEAAAMAAARIREFVAAERARAERTERWHKMLAPSERADLAPSPSLSHGSFIDVPAERVLEDA